MLGMIFNVVSPIQAAIAIGEPLCDLGIPSIEPLKLYLGSFNKIRVVVYWLIAAGSPARVEPEMLGMVLDNLQPVQVAFVVGEPLCDRGISS